MKKTIKAKPKQSYLFILKKQPYPNFDPTDWSNKFKEINTTQKQTSCLLPKYARNDLKNHRNSKWT